MKGLNEFIIEIGQAFHNTIKHGTLELYTDFKGKEQEQSNRIGKVINIPMQQDSDIKIGAEVLIEPTVLFSQHYRGKEQKSQFIVNETKGWYRVEPMMIILYKNPGEDWKGHQMNLLVEPIKEETQKTGTGILLGENKDKFSYAKVAFTNNEIEKQDVKAGDTIIYPKEMKWPFQLEGKEYLYLRNRDLLGKSI
jgi:co-chaperonin GroES (HSP10)